MENAARRAFGDNRVVLIPSEIERIREYTGLSKLEVAGPFVPDTTIPDEPGEAEENSLKILSGVPEENEEPFSPEFLELLQEDIDCEGNIHAFGWILRRKRNGDCIFLEKGYKQMPGLSSAPNALQHLSLLYRRAEIADLRM